MSREKINLKELISNITTNPEIVNFDEVISVIDSEYKFTPTKFGMMAVVDAGEVMPSKSTWFEPKLADGLVSHILD